MKKQLLITILLTILMSMVETKAFAYDIAVANDDGVTIYYNYIKDAKELEVTHAFNSYEGDLIIPEEVTYMNRTRKVTSIGRDAFSYCKITSVTIPNSVTSIGNNAFEHCINLTSVVIPNSLLSIGSYTFSGCTKLTSFFIPKSIKSIDRGAFYGCEKLNSVQISDLEAWCRIQFSNEYSNPLRYAHHLYLNDNEVKDLIIPDVITSIKDEAFRECKGLSTVTIPNSVTTIGKNAFRDCSSIISVIIPSSVTSIGDYAFFGTDIPTIISEIRDIFPISTTVFSNNTYINATLYVPAGTKYKYSTTNGWKNFKYIEGDEGPDGGSCGNNVNYYYDNETHKLTISGQGAMKNYKYEETPWFLYANDIKEVIIESGVTSIGDHAFADCYNLTYVTIPNGVTSIGVYAFLACNLSYIEIPNTVTTIGDWSFAACSFTDLTIPNSVTEIGENAFCECDKLTNVIISNNVSSIKNSTFSNCRNLTSVNIPNSVTSIGSSAFSGCRSLKSITIPNSVTSIGDRAFSGADFSTIISEIENPFAISDNTFSKNTFDNAQLYVPLGTEDLYRATAGWNIFVFLEASTKFINYSYDNKTHTLTISGQGEMENYEYAETPWFPYANDIKEVIIESGVTSIGNNAFDGCRGLTSVTIPNSVTSIGESAFYGCSGLTWVTIPNSVASIDNNAFSNCSGLTTIISERTNPIEIGDNVFSNYTTAKLVVPEGTKSAYQSKAGWKKFQNIIEFEKRRTIHVATAGTLSNQITEYDKSHIEELKLTGKLNGDDLGLLRQMAGKRKDGFDEYNRGLSGSYFGTISSKLSILDISEVKIVSGGTYLYLECSDSKFSRYYEVSENTIPDYVFCACKLTSIELPTNITSVGELAFSECSLTSITIPNSVTSIGDYAFSDCRYLTSITIPNSVTSIGDYAFIGCSQLMDYYIWAENVPSTNYIPFFPKEIKNATLHVPAASVDIYRQTDPWSDFGKIVPLTDEDPNPTSMKGIMQSYNLSSEYYDLTGRKVNHPKKGLYIKNGKKVVLK